MVNVFKLRPQFRQPNTPLLSCNDLSIKLFSYWNFVLLFVQFQDITFMLCNFKKLEEEEVILVI